MSRHFETFSCWRNVLVAHSEGVPLYYARKPDSVPIRVVVVRAYKNGKLRINGGGGVAFTADRTHAGEFRYLSDNHTVSLVSWEPREGLAMVALSEDGRKHGGGGQ